MNLIYKSIDGNHQEMKIKSIDFLHGNNNNTATVVDNTGKSYVLDTQRILQIKS